MTSNIKRKVWLMQNHSMDHVSQVCQTFMHHSLVNAFTIIKDLKYAIENIIL